VVSRRPSTGARPRDVSFVVQGPIERSGQMSTARTLASIRAHFPGAEIVISSWEGSDLRGLDYDRSVLSPDPGAVSTFGYNVSTNRLIDSSLAGVQAATRPLVVKLRSDVQFRSDALLAHWDQWRDRSDQMRLFKHRVLVPNVFTRRPSSLNPRPLHPSDWAVFGTKEDLLTLFEVPHMGAGDAAVLKPLPEPLRRYHPNVPVPRGTPEQWIWMCALRKADKRVWFNHHFDLTPETLQLTELGFANNLAILDAYTQFGLWNPKYTFPNRVFEDPTLVQHEDWLELYDIHCGGGAIARREVAPLLERIAAGELDDLTHEDASRLRRAGLGWEAQLVDCVSIRGYLRRDSTTGAHYWDRDQVVLRHVRQELPARAAQAVAAGRRPAVAGARR
jgi:hypothetical protein